MTFDFRCQPYHRTYGTNPRVFVKLFSFWASPGLQCTYCRPGRRITGARSCTNCPAGYDQPYHTGTTCRQCHAGRYAPSPATPQCLACQPGSYQPYKGRTSCDLCEPGTYAPSSRSTSCTRCPKGTYQDLRGQTSCKPCPYGYYQDTEGSTVCKEMQMDLGCKDPFGLDGESKLKPGYCGIAVDYGLGQGPTMSCVRELEAMPAADSIHAVCHMCNSGRNTDVFTFRSTPVRARVEVAHGKPTKASSTMYGSPSNVVDTNDRILRTITPAQATASNPAQFNEFPSTCFATNVPSDSSYPVSWWRVDLGEAVEIDTVEVYAPEASPNGGNGIGGYYWMQVSNAAGSQEEVGSGSFYGCRSPTYNNRRLPYSYPDGHIVEWDCSGSPPSRYVWIRRRWSTVALCEVKVYTREPAPPAIREGIFLSAPAYAQLRKPWTVWPATVAAWISCGTGGNNVQWTFLGTETGNRNDRGYNIIVLADGRVQIWWDGRTTVVTADVNVRTGSFVHLAVVHRVAPAAEAGFHVYVNGVPTFVPAIVRPVYPVRPAVFGRDYRGVASSFGGHIDHIEVHSVPLSTEEIKAIMSRPAGQCASGKTVMGCYTLRNPSASDSTVRHSDASAAGIELVVGFTSKVAYTSCDDTKLCTMNDHCVAGIGGGEGRCIGRLYTTCLKEAFTGDALLDCEECDGVGGCAPVPGKYSGLNSAGERTCGCWIDGFFTAHLERNPNNPCQQCNLAHSNTDWFDMEGASCINSDRCTRNSKCRLDPDPAVRISCQATETYTCPPLPCAKRRTCNWDDGCEDEFWRPSESSKPRRCQVNSDPCTEDSYCEVRRAECPDPEVTAPVIRSGTFDTALPNAPHRFSGQTSYLTATFAGWSAVCGGLVYEFGVKPVDPAAATCDDTNADLGPPDKVPNTKRRVSITRRDLSMTHNSHYVAVLRLTNYVGDQTVACSPPFMVDATPPEVLGAVEHLHPARLPVETVTSTHYATYLAARWRGAFADGDSNAGVPLDYAMIVHSDPSFILRWRPSFVTGQELRDTRGSFTTRDSRSYYITVYARNRAGRVSSLTTAGPVLIDQTPPSAGAVRDGSASDSTSLAYVALTPDLRLGVNWDAFVDNHGSVSYEVGFGFRPGQDTVAAFRAVSSTPRRYSLPDAAVLTHGARVYASVRATNAAGLHATASSDGVYIDATPPRVFSSFFVQTERDDATGAIELTRIATSYNGTQYQSHSYAFAAVVYCGDDLPRQGMTYVVSIGTSPGVSDVLGPVKSTSRLVETGSIPVADQVPPFTTLYVWGTCTNDAGLTSTLTPWPLLVDPTPPDTSAAFVRHVDTSQPGSPTVAFTARTTLEATFGGWFDPESGIRSGPPCQFAVVEYGAPAPDEDDRFAWRYISAASFLSVTAAQFTTTHGTTYQFWVRCYNRAGDAGLVVSPGITVHRVAPVAATINDGPATPLSLTLLPDTSTPSDAATAAQVLHTAAALDDGDLSTGFATDVAASPNADGEMNLDVAFVDGPQWIDSVTVAPLATLGSPIPPLRLYTLLGTDAEWSLAATVELDAAPGAETTVLFAQPRFTTALRVASPGGIQLPLATLRVASADVDGLAAPVTSLSMSWADVEDPTGIVSASWSVATCVGGGEEEAAGEGGDAAGHVVIPFTTSGVDVEAMTASLPIASALLSATRYCTTVRLTSAVGLTAEFVSDGFVVFTSPPTAAFVSDGPATGLDADIQRSTSQVTATWLFEDAALPNGGAGSLAYAWKAGTTPGGDDVFAWRPAGTATSGTATGLSIPDGTTVYVTVQATNPAGLTAEATSDGVAIDSSLPGGLGLVDGGLAQVNVVINPALTLLTASWPIAGGASQFLFTVGTCSGCDDVQPLLSVGTATAGAVASTYAVGTTYYVDAFAHTALGLVLYGHGSVVADNTPPLITTLQSNVSAVSGTNEGLTATYDIVGTTLNVSWLAAVDVTVVTYSWMVGTSAGTSTLYGPVAAGTALSDSVNDLVLHPSPLPYYVTLVATNAGGLTSQVSVQLFVDEQGPLRGWVIDGDGERDAQFQSSTTALQCAFGGFVDPISTVAAYYAGFGTDVGSTDVVPFAQVWSAADGPTPEPLRHTLSADTLSLSQGTTYYCVVKAIDGRGFASTVSSSGVIIETTAPKVGTVYDGARYGHDAQYQDTLTGVWASWRHFADPESGIASFDWGVGTSPGADDVLAYHSVGLATAGAAPDVALSPGVVYYSTVKAWNGRGLATESVSDGFQVDLSTPPAPSVQADAVYLIAEGTANRDTCTCPTPGAAFDPATGRCECQGDRTATLVTDAYGSHVECVCDEAGACNDAVLPQAPPTLTACEPPAYADRYGDHAVEDGTGACVCAAGLYLVNETRHCSPCPVDTYKAGAGDDAALCVPCWHGGSISGATTTLDVAWTSTGAAQYDVLTGTAPEVAPFSASLPSYDSSFSFAGLPMQQGSQWFVTVKAIAPGGGVSSASAAASTVDMLPPRFGAVVDLAAEGDEVDATFQTDVTALRMSWSGWSSASAVARVQVAWGTTPYGTDTSSGWLDVADPATTTSYVLTTALAQGTTYYATVRATSARGVASERTSDGVTVDATPPDVAAAVVIADTAPCGTGDVDVSADTDGVEASWAGVFSDAASGITLYHYSVVDIGTGDVLVPWTASYATRAAVDTSTAHGATPQFQVTATNGAGLTSAVISSDGVLVDTTAPVALSPPAFVDANGDEVAFWSTLLSARVAVEFVDTESGIDSVALSFGTSPGGADAGGCVLDALNDGAPSSLVAQTTVCTASFVNGNAYYVTAVATSTAGVASAPAIAPAPVVVDITPPTGASIAIATDTGDAAFQTDGEVFSVTGTGWDDSESGIATAEVVLVHANAGLEPEILAPGWVPVQLSHGGAFAHTFTDVAGLPDGAEVQVWTQATNGAGLTALVESTAVTVDTTPPSLTRVAGVRVSSQPLPVLAGGQQAQGTEVPADPVFVPEGTVVHASWQLVFDDPHSAIKSFSWSVLATNADGSPSATVLAGPFATLASDVSGSAPLELLQGDRYIVEVTATNHVGLATTVASGLVTVDGTAPAMGGASLVGDAGARLPVAVDLGAALAGQSTCRCATSFARFDRALGACRCVPGRYFDPATAGCEECTVDTADQADCQPRASVFSWPVTLPTCSACPDGSWRRVPTDPDATSACDQACLACPAPTPAFVAADTPGPYQLRLSGFTSTLAPVSSLRVSLGTATDGGVQHMSPVTIVDPTVAGDDLVSAPFTLRHGQLVVASVVATTAAGVSATAVLPLAIVDATPPAAAAASLQDVGATTAEPSAFLSRNDSSIVAWAGVSDRTSSIATLAVAATATLCSAASPVGDDDLLAVAPGDIATDGSVVYTLPAAAVHGMGLYPCVKATNGAGATTWLAGAKAVVDLRAPVPGVVRDGADPTADADCVLLPFGGESDDEGDTIGVSWTGFGDATSGVHQVHVALGFQHGDASVMPWTPVSVADATYEVANVTMLRDSLLATPSAVLFWSVRVTDGVGLTSWASSNGFTIACADAAFGGDEAAHQACAADYATQVAAAQCVSTAPRASGADTAQLDDNLPAPA